jgi:hypothetical protein
MLNSKKIKKRKLNEVKMGMSYFKAIFQHSVGETSTELLIFGPRFELGTSRIHKTRAIF